MWTTNEYSNNKGKNEDSNNAYYQCMWKYLIHTINKTAKPQKKKNKYYKQSQIME